MTIDDSDNISGIGPALIGEYNTGQFAELVASLPMGTTPGTLTALLRIPLEVQAGDIIFGAGDVEVTHPSAQAYNFSVAAALAISPNADLLANTQYIDLVTGATIGDVTGDQHHQIIKVGSIQTIFSGLVYVGLVAYAYSSSALGGHILTVEAGSGKLSLLHYRPQVMPFIANAVSFDGVNDYLRRVGGLDGAKDGKQVTISCFVRKQGADATSAIIFSSQASFVGDRFRLVVGTTNQFAIGANNAAGTLILNVSSSNNVFEAADGWVHVMFSCDLSDVAKRHLYINDASDLTVSTYTNDTMDHTIADWSVGAHPDGSTKLALDIAELWVSFSYIDLSQVANRRKFIDANLKPVNLGPNGIIPDISAGNYRMPEVYLTGPTANWHLNRGKGGPFTVTGALTTAATSPSD